MLTLDDLLQQMRGKAGGPPPDPIRDTRIKTGGTERTFGAPSMTYQGPPVSAPPSAASPGPQLFGLPGIGAALALGSDLSDSPLSSAPPSPFQQAAQQAYSPGQRSIFDSAPAPSPSLPFSASPPAAQQPLDFTPQLPSIPLSPASAGPTLSPPTPASAPAPTAPSASAAPLISSGPLPYVATPIASGDGGPISRDRLAAAAPSAARMAQEVSRLQSWQDPRSPLSDQSRWAMSQAPVTTAQSLSQLQALAPGANPAVLAQIAGQQMDAAQQNATRQMELFGVPGDATRPGSLATALIHAQAPITVAQIRDGNENSLEARVARQAREIMSRNPGMPPTEALRQARELETKLNPATAGQGGGTGRTGAGGAGGTGGTGGTGSAPPLPQPTPTERMEQATYAIQSQGQPPGRARPLAPTDIPAVVNSLPPNFIQENPAAFTDFMRRQFGDTAMDAWFTRRQPSISSLFGEPSADERARNAVISGVNAARPGIVGTSGANTQSPWWVRALTSGPATSSMIANPLTTPIGLLTRYLGQR